MHCLHRVFYPKTASHFSENALTDHRWSLIELHCLGKKSDPSRSGNDNRLFIEAILWKARTNSPWRDLPEIFGKWNTVFRAFSENRFTLFGKRSKILALTDALGNLVRFHLLPRHRFDTIGIAPLIKDIDFGMLLADKAYDAHWIIEELQQRGAKIVISQSARRKAPLPIDLEV